MTLINSDSIDDIVIHSGNHLDVDLYPLAIGSFDERYVTNHVLLSPNDMRPIYVSGPNFSISRSPLSNMNNVIGVLKPEQNRHIYLAAISRVQLPNRLTSVHYVDVPDFVLQNMTNVDIYIVTSDRIIPISFDRSIPTNDIVVVKPRTGMKPSQY